MNVSLNFFKVVLMILTVLPFSAKAIDYECNVIKSSNFSEVVDSIRFEQDDEKHINILYLDDNGVVDVLVSWFKEKESGDYIYKTFIKDDIGCVFTSKASNKNDLLQVYCTGIGLGVIADQSFSFTAEQCREK